MNQYVSLAELIVAPNNRGSSKLGNSQNVLYIFRIRKIRIHSYFFPACLGKTWYFGNKYEPTRRQLCQ